MEQLFTLTEIAEKLRVSKHTVQAWMSPSSPNHKPEFAAMARHSGRKTVFLENDINTWLEQRKGANYSNEAKSVSAYWRESFAELRGLLKEAVVSPKLTYVQTNSFFSGGMLALDLEALMIWLTDGKAASSILRHLREADGLVLYCDIAMTLLWKMRDKAKYSKKYYEALYSAFFEKNIFEFSYFNEQAMKSAQSMPNDGLSEFAAKTYCASISAGADALLTTNKKLDGLSGLKVMLV